MAAVVQKQEDSDENDDVVLLLPANVFSSDSDNEENEKEEDKAASKNQLQQRCLRSINSTVVIRQLPSEGISFKLWPPAATLVNILDNHRSDPTTSPLGPTLSTLANTRLRVLELGSGTGLVGICAAVLLKADVTLTDLPNVVGNLRFNVDANKGVVELHGGSVHVARLRWGEREDIEVIGREFDVVVGSDLVYHEHLFEPLLRTLEWLLLEGGKIVFVMAHYRRWKKDNVFFKKARKMFHVGVVHVDGRNEGSRSPVVVYRFVARRRAEV